MVRSAIAACSLFFALGATRADFTLLNYPGAGFTSAKGISGSTVVGTYNLGTGPGGTLGHDFGYVYHGGQYTSLMAPWPSSTTPTAIDGKNIVGYTEADGSGQSGFLYNGSSWIPLHFPGASETQPLGISGNTIIGTYRTPASPMLSSFIYNGSTWTTFSAPGAFATIVSGIDGKNIVGSWFDSGSGLAHGFLYNGSSWTSINVPGSTDTRTMAISGNTIVGESGELSWESAFLYNGQTYTPFNFPGSIWTDLYGISGTNMIGWEEPPAAISSSFLYTADAPEPSSLTLMALGALGAAAYRWRSQFGRSHFQAMICFRRAI